MFRCEDAHDPIRTDTEPVETGYSQLRRARERRAAGIASSVERQSETRSDARAVLHYSDDGRGTFIHESDEVGTFDSFDKAAAWAVERVGVGSYLVRVSGASTVTLPASVVFQQTG